MKRCRECNARYDDSVSFCAKDGRALAAEIDGPARLCPHCANGIPQDAVRCPHCNKDLGAPESPQWPRLDKTPLESGTLSETTKTRPLFKAILIVGIAVFALGVFLIGERKERSGSQQVLDEKISEIHEKDQRIQSLETDLNQSRAELSNNVRVIAELRTALEASKKELTLMQERLIAANREADRLSAVRPQAPPRPAPPTQDPVPPAPVRRAAEIGLYETTRATEVHEDPSGSSRVVSQIAKGTRFTVVGSVGDWLEVRSKHGNPPGFVRRGNAMFVGRAN